MVTCKGCNSILGVIFESEMVHLIGELNVHFICGKCGEANSVILSDYQEKETNKKKEVQLT